MARRSDSPTHVLDASAMIAVLLAEPGAEVVQEAGPGALMSAVNMSETVAKVLDRGADLQTVLGQLRNSPLKVVPFDRPQAEAAGALRTATRRKNISFADRACLALAIETNLPVLTTDRAWVELDLGVQVRLIR